MVSLSDSFHRYILDFDEEEDNDYSFSVEIIFNFDNFMGGNGDLGLIDDKNKCKKSYNCHYRSKCKFSHSEKEKAFFKRDLR